MADVHDGSIVIDTELDYKGFEQGSEKLLSAIKNLSSEIRSFGVTMGKSLDAATAAIRGLSQITEAVYERLGTGATQAADANTRFASTMDAARQSVSGAARAAGVYDSALAKAQKQIDAQKAKLSEYFKQVAEIRAATDESLKQTTTDDQAAKVLEIEEIELQKLNEKYAAQLDALKKLEAEYQRLAAAQAQARQSENPTPAYNVEDVKAVAADIEKAIRAVDGYQAKINKMRAVGASDRAWQSTRYDIAQATAQLQEYRRNLDALQASGKISPEEYERLSSALDTATAKARQLTASANGASAFREKLQQIGAAALRTASNLAKIPFRAADKGFKALTNGIKNFIKNSKGARIQANALVKTLTSLKRMMITRVKRMFISGIFNAVKESLQTLTKFSDAFNQSMSNIKNSAKQLSGNLAVSIGGLIQAIEPMLTTFINTMSKAMTYMNAFFALLSGKSTMTVAKKQTDSYRDSLDSAAKSAEELKNQVYGFDELNKRSGKDEMGSSDGSDLFEEVPIDSVLPESLRELFDQLKALWGNSDFFNFGKKLAELFNTGLKNLDDWFNNVLRPKGAEWAKNIAELFNGLVDGIDWKLLGKTLADGLNTVFDIVNTFLTNFDFEALGKDIGDAINGWFDNIEWGLIGQTFANGWNSLVDFIFGIVNQVNWDTVGDSIAKAIQSFFNTIDWDKTARTIVTAVNGIVEAFQHLIDGVNWQQIGQNIGKSLSDSLSGIDWGAAFKAVIDGVVSLEKLILGSIQGFEWGDVGKALADGLNGINFSEHFQTVGQTISDALNGVLDFLIQFIENVNWSEYAQKLWDGLILVVESIDFKALVSKAFELLGAAIGAASSFIGTLVLNIVEMIIEAIDGIGDYFGEYIKECGGDIVAGLWEGIKNAFANVGNWIKENILDPFIDGFKQAFGINSPSTVMMEMGKYIVEGLLQGIKGIWDTVTSWFSTALSALKSTISNAWNGIKTATATAWEGIKNTVQQKFEAAKTAITTTANNIKTALSTAWNAVKSTASTAWSAIKSTVQQKFDGLKNNISSSANSIKSTLSTAWNSVKSSTSTAWTSIKSTVSSTLSGLKSSVSSGASGIHSAVQSAWNKVQSSTSSAWNSLKSSVMGLWEGLKTSMKGTDWTSVGSNLVSGLQRGISNMWSSITSTVSSLARSVTSTLQSIFSIHSPSKVWAEIGEYLDLGLKKGLEDKQGSVLSTVSDMAKNVNAEVMGEKATLQIGAEGDTMVSRLGIISDRLAGIVGAFQSINSVLSEMGGIRIPMIAAGVEVPYKTRVGETGLDLFDSNSFESFSSGIDERMVDQTSLLRRICDLLEKQRGNIDSDELAQAIAFAIRGAARGYGV